MLDAKRGALAHHASMATAPTSHTGRRLLPDLSQFRPTSARGRSPSRGRDDNNEFNLIREGRVGEQTSPAITPAVPAREPRGVMVDGNRPRSIDRSSDPRLDLVTPATPPDEYPGSWTTIHT